MGLVSEVEQRGPGTSEPDILGHPQPEFPQPQTGENETNILTGLNVSLDKAGGQVHVSHSSIPGP